MHVYIFLEASQQNSSKHIGSPTENPKGVREHWGKEVFFDLPSLCAAFLFFSVLFVCFLARNSSLSLFVNIVPATFNFASHVQRNSYAFFLCLTLAVLFIHLPETTMVKGLRLFSVTKFLVLDLQHLHQFFQRFMRKMPCDVTFFSLESTGNILAVPRSIWNSKPSNWGDCGRMCLVKGGVG